MRTRRPTPASGCVTGSDPRPHYLPDRGAYCSANAGTGPMHKKKIEGGGMNKTAVGRILESP
jgi:hypothetical protein